MTKALPRPSSDTCWTNASSEAARRGVAVVNATGVKWSRVDFKRGHSEVNTMPSMTNRSLSKLGRWLKMHIDTPTGYGGLLVADDWAALAGVAADHLFTWTMETSKPVRVTLSGGSTPRRTYQGLTGRRFTNGFPWRRVHWFWGDERVMPPDHPDSNFRMTRGAMLDTAPAHPRTFIRSRGRSQSRSIHRRVPTAAAEHLWRPAYRPGRELFHISPLGLGDEGTSLHFSPASGAGRPYPLERCRGGWNRFWDSGAVLRCDS